jgi:hypothetical protein
MARLARQAASARRKARIPARGGDALAVDTG